LGLILIDGRLLKRNSLLEGIRNAAQWHALDDVVLSGFAREAKALVEKRAARQSPDVAAKAAAAPLDLEERRRKGEASTPLNSANGVAGYSPILSNKLSGWRKGCQFPDLFALIDEALFASVSNDHATARVDVAWALSAR
jgi:hypothetical protein